MIKMGIYGLLRTLTFLGPPPAWWGTTLLIAGALSALAGVVLALAQHDLKRLLAYSSVENIGIIALGIGVGVLGSATHAARGRRRSGFAGALLHTLNHGLFKGLLFHVAGAVLHATGTRDLETQRRPAAAHAGDRHAGARRRRRHRRPAAAQRLRQRVADLRRRRCGSGDWCSAPGGAIAVLVVPVLALVGGLATACFVRLFGVVFLGEPRTPPAPRRTTSAARCAWRCRSRPAPASPSASCRSSPSALVAGAAAQLAGGAGTPAMLGLAALTTLSLMAALLVGRGRAR